MSVAEQIYYLRKDDASAIRPQDVLHYVLVGEENGGYPGGVDHAAIEGMGVRIINVPLVSDASRPYIDGKLLVPVFSPLLDVRFITKQAENGVTVDSGQRCMTRQHDISPLALWHSLSERLWLLPMKLLFS